MFRCRIFPILYCLLSCQILNTKTVSSHIDDAVHYSELSLRLEGARSLIRSRLEARSEETKAAATASEDAGSVSEQLGRVLDSRGVRMHPMHMRPMQLSLPRTLAAGSQTIRVLPVYQLPSSLPSTTQTYVQQIFTAAIESIQNLIQARAHACIYGVRTLHL